jgi:hypothetical protein
MIANTRKYKKKRTGSLRESGSCNRKQSSTIGPITTSRNIHYSLGFTARVAIKLFDPAVAVPTCDRIQVVFHSLQSIL